MFVYKNISRFDIAVDDVPAVKVRQTLQNLFYVITDDMFTSFLSNSMHDILPSDILCYDVQEFVIIISLEIFHNSRVVYLSEAVIFLLNQA